MGDSVSSGKRSRWFLSREQNAFVAVLLLVLLTSYLIGSRSGLFPWQGNATTPPSPPDPFVIEVEGSPAVSGIYTFSTEVGIEEVLVQAGVAREHIPQETLPRRLRTGAKIFLNRSGQNLDIRVEPMDPAKKILYTLPIDLNEIQEDELPLIPGIGPTLAKRIVDYRDHKGGFTRFDELLDVSGIGRKKLQALRRYLSVERDASPTP
jgi:competence protein ComEA